MYICVGCSVDPHAYGIEDDKVYMYVCVQVGCSDLEPHVVVHKIAVSYFLKFLLFFCQTLKYPTLDDLQIKH